MVTLGSYVRKCRGKLNERHGDFSIRAVARRIGIHQSYLSKLERGEHAPLSEATLVALARDLGEDQDLICALGGRMPARISELLGNYPERFVDFVRELEQESGRVNRFDSSLSRSNQRKADLEELVRRLRKEVVERHRLEKSLALEEQRLRLILDNLQGAIVLLLDSELNVVWASESMRAACGFPECIVGEKCYRACCGADAPCSDCSVRQALDLGEVHHEVVRGKIGNRCWKVTNIPLKDADGKVTRVLRYGFDITEIEETKKALDDSEKRWKFALEGSQLGVWDWDVASGHEYHSPLWKTMLGYSADEHLDSKATWESLIHPDDYQETVHVASQHLLNLTPLYERAHRLQCKDGGYKWIRSRGLAVARSPEGAPVRVIGTHEDISLQKHFELVAEENTAMLTAVFNAIPIGISVVNEDMTIRFVNEYLKASIADLYNVVGEVCYSVFSARRDVCEGCPVKKAFESKRTEVSLVQVSRGDIHKCVKIVAVPILDPGAIGVKCVVELVRDVTKEYELGLLDLDGML